MRLLKSTIQKLKNIDRTSFSLFLINVLILFSCSNKTDNTSETLGPINEEIDNYITALMEADKIPGLAMAVVKKGQVIHEKYYGIANIAHKVPVTDSTLFRMYSTSKLITSAAIFQLVEREKVALDDSISKYIDGLPKSWGDIRVDHLLAHSSGLPELEELDKELSDESLLSEIVKRPLHFKSGAKFEYNQTNFWFLKSIIEMASNQRFEKFIKLNQFKNRGNEVIFASNSLVDYPNRVAKYQFNKQYDAYEITSFAAGNRLLASNGLNTNLSTLLEWNIKLDKNQLLTEETKSKMMSPYRYRGEDFPFGYGWGIFGPEGKRYYGFAGGGVCAIMKFLDKDLTIIILSNGFKNSPVMSNAITYISGLSDTSLTREDRMLNEDVRLAFILEDYGEAVKKYEQLSSENIDINFQRALNSSGHHYLSENQIEKSINIFKLNTREYPNAANAFDSLGEAYFKNEQYGLSKKNYEKSLELDPKKLKFKRNVDEN